MSIFESILPKNSTDFEKHLEQAADFSHLPIAELADLINPWKIDARYLPWLAYRFAIEVWQEGWGEQKKRSVIARALELQRIKGTKRGLREYVKLVDGEVKQIVTAPQHLWVGSGLTQADLAAWHETMPQIRVYFVNRRMSAKEFSFVCHSFIGHAVANINVGRALYGRQAALWDRGQEQPLKMVDIVLDNKRQQAVQSERVSISGLAGKLIYAGSHAGYGFCQAIIKKPEIITWNREITYIVPSMQVSTTTLSPSLQPLDIRARRKSEKWTDRHGAAIGRFFNYCFIMPNIAREKLFDCLFLHDKDRALPKMRAMSFASVAKLGFLPFRAHILVDLQLKQQGKASFAGVAISGRHIAQPFDKTKLQAQLRAIVLSKAVRDKIFVSFQTTRSIRFGDGISLSTPAKFNSRLNNRL